MNGVEAVQDEARDVNGSQIDPSTACTLPKQQGIDKPQRCIQREARELE